MINLRNQDYRLPGNNEELNEMIEKMIDCGMSTKSEEAKIKKIKKQYETAVKKYVTASKNQRNINIWRARKWLLWDGIHHREITHPCSSI